MLLKNNFDTSKANEWYLFSNKTVNEDQQQTKRKENNNSNVGKLDGMPLYSNN